MIALRRIFEKFEVWMNRLLGKPDTIAGNSRSPSGAHESASNTNPSDPDELPIAEAPSPGTTTAPSGATDEPGEREPGTPAPPPTDAAPPSSATTTNPAGATDEPGEREPGTPAPPPTDAAPPSSATTTNPAGATDEPGEREPGTPASPPPDAAPPSSATTTAPSGATDEPGEREPGTPATPPTDAAPPSSATTTNPAGATDEPGEREPGTSDARASDTPRRPGEDDVSEGDTDSSDMSRSGKPASPKPPSETGGKRSDGSGGRASRPREPRTADPELICRIAPASDQWELSLIDGDGGSIESVRRGDTNLKTVNGEWLLSSFAGGLVVDFDNGERDEIPLFNGRQPLIFKLGNDWSGAGRRRYRIASGHFIVIAPKDWERTGHVPLEPGACADAGFRAHHFFRDRGDAGDEIGGFRECGPLSTGSGIGLDGHRVFDDGDDGELFGREAPILKNLDDLCWARVGEEKKDGWKGGNFRPSEKSLGDVLGKRQGRFFVRVYDKTEGKLRDSAEFRYLRDLKEIHLNGEAYDRNSILVPPENGYAPARVRFIGFDGAVLSPILAPDARYVDAESNGLLVAAHPDADRVSCALNADVHRVNIVLKLPRIWWRFEPDRDEPGEWLSVPVTMTRGAFRERAYAGEAIRLRMPRRITDVYVGFDDELDRKYRPERDEDNVSREFEVNLDDFADYRQIDERLCADAWLNVKLGEIVLPLVRVSADPAPRIVSFSCQPTAVVIGQAATLRWETRNSEPGEVTINPEIGSVKGGGSLEIGPSMSTAYTLTLAAPGLEDVSRTVMLEVLKPSSTVRAPTARVKRADGGWRRGRGFSCRELRSVGLTKVDARRRSMPVDRRRRSVHEVNVEMIGELVDA